MALETKSTPSAMRKPLAGLRVLDFSMFMAGPYCTRYLADLGADVLKVEPEAGDNLRNGAPLREGCSSYFGQINVGKRSVVLDLKDETQRRRAAALARSADVVVENGRPGTMRKFGLDYESLRDSNPGIIYCSISGFGQSGPGADRPAFAQTMHALCGLDLAYAAYQDGPLRPPNTGIFTADILAGVYAFSGILTALYDRERTGLGQLVDLAMLDAMLNLLPYEFQEAQFPSPKRRPVYKPMRTADGFVMVGLISPKNFDALFDLMGKPEWKADERYGNPQARAENWDELMALVEQWTCQQETEQCVRQVKEAGLAVTRYQTVKEAMRDPQLAARGSVSTVWDDAGTFAVANLPFKMSNAATEAQGRVAALGEHTWQVMSPQLGNDWPHKER